MSPVQEDLRLSGSQEVEVQDRQEVLLQMGMYPGIQKGEKMTTTKCDRCKKTIESAHIIHISHLTISGMLRSTTHVKLCKDCMTSLWGWINENGRTKSQ